MSDKQLNILTEDSSGFFKDRGSKFHAFAFPVQDENDIAGHLGALRKKYYDARHHCYAYRIGIRGETSMANDDREPSHSAGDPILGQILHHGLTNVLIVVVRYFGGTKLGIRGLIEAYKAAAADAIANNHLEELKILHTIRIRFPYEHTSLINRILHKFPVSISDASYTDRVVQSLEIDEKLSESLILKLEQSGIIIEEILT